MDDNTNPWSQRLALLMSMLPTIQAPPDAFPEQGIVHARLRDKARYGSCIEGYDSWFAGPAAAESLDGTASLKPKPSICHSAFDPLDCRDGDHSSGRHRID
jgi:hypothetical protein